MIFKPPYTDKARNVKSRLRPLFSIHWWIFDTNVPWQLGDSCSSFMLRYTTLN